MPFQPAVRKKVKLKLALSGPSGAGKTLTALRMAMALADGGGIAMVDTENGSGSLYVGEIVPEGVLKYDVEELKHFSVNNYVNAIHAACNARIPGPDGKPTDKPAYSVLVIDTISAVWNGIGGVLESVNNAPGANGFAKWKKGDELYRQFVHALLASPIHVIATTRAKVAYTQETDERGNKSVRKLGMGSVQRKDIEYEFSVVGELDIDHRITFSKTRCRELADQTFVNAGGDVIQVLKGWLERGVDVEAEPFTALPPPSSYAGGDEVSRPPAGEGPPPGDDYPDAGDPPAGAGGQAPTQAHQPAGAGGAAPAPAGTTMINGRPIKNTNRADVMKAYLDYAVGVPEVQKLIDEISAKFTQAEKDKLKPACKQALIRERAKPQAAPPPAGAATA